MVRYSIIHEKNPREIVLLRGTGCRWRRCTFCDYHLDSSNNEEDNFKLNQQAMSKVTGIYHHLEVINSGSFPELDKSTMDQLITLCREKQIHTLHFECHWLYRNEIPDLRQKFANVGTTLKIKTGVESFDYNFRENVLCKGITEHDPAKIAEQFDECCLLFGLSGQTVESMRKDIQIGLEFFERVCVNVFIDNETKVKADEKVIHDFVTQVMPNYVDNDRVDILLNNTDFGVGDSEADYEE